MKTKINPPNLEQERIKVLHFVVDAVVLVGVYGAGYVHRWIKEKEKRR